MNIDVDVTHTTTIAQIPHDRMADIFSYLTPKERLIADQVCKAWHSILAAEHGQMHAVSASLFGSTFTHLAHQIPDDLVAQCLRHRVNDKGFAPLETIFINPNLYPQGKRLLSSTDLKENPRIVSAWYTALFGKAASQDPHALPLVMSALPQILVNERVGKDALDAITYYVEKVGRNTRFMRFTGSETQADLDALHTAPHTLVVRAQDMQAHKDSLSSPLNARNDHPVVLCFDDETFIKNGALTMSKNHIPHNLRHLILSDPFDKITSIEPSFLMLHEGLESFSARGLTATKTIKLHFLSSCKNLTICDVRGLAKVASIGACFVFKCPKVEKFDSRGFANLTEISGGFLKDSTGLTDFNAGGLTYVKSIFHSFLHGCTSLTNFDPTPLTRLKQLGQDFLSQTALTLDARTKVDAFLERVHPEMIPTAAIVLHQRTPTSLRRCD
ncbi:MAG: F-box protein [Proteobacteria bacterium]|nr:F-box protein [Pseudomonadota bacterium]